MTKLRKQLPPLDTLVFFEAVMRTGSFTAASTELYVSQAAVSKRVRQLEDWLGTELFMRSARSLTLTPAGEALTDPVAMALDYLRPVVMVTQFMAAVPTGILKISVGKLDEEFEKVTSAIDMLVRDF